MIILNKYDPSAKNQIDNIKLNIETSKIKKQQYNGLNGLHHYMITISVK